MKPFEEISDQNGVSVPAEDRTKSLEQAKVWAICLSVLAGIISIPLIFVSHPPTYKASLALLVLLPPLGILLRFRFPLLFAVLKRNDDPRADTGFFVMWPGAAVMFSYQTGNDPSHLVDGSQIFGWALLIMACYVAALLRSAWANHSRWKLIPMVLLMGGMYGTGASNAMNTLLDRSPTYTYRSHVLKSYVKKGKHGTFNLSVASWGPVTESEDVVVDGSLYKQVKPGDEVCIVLHPGFLHSPWYTLAPCDR